MGWSLVLDELPDLLAAFDDAERQIDPAFTAAVEPFGVPGVEPEVLQFRPDRAEWQLLWRLPLPDRLSPNEHLHCRVGLRKRPVASDGRAPAAEAQRVSGELAVEHYRGGGFTDFTPLWESVSEPVASPAAAAAAIRAVAAELASQLGQVDLRPYLADSPGPAGGPARPA